MAFHRLISSFTYRIYTIYPLSRLTWFFLLGLAVWTALAVAMDSSGHGKAWRRCNGWIAVVYTVLLLYMTVASRSETPYGGLRLLPFYSFYLAREENREFYRTLLMNVFLFFPLGLTLPFGLSARKRPVLQALLLGILLSVCIEALQYAFSLGWAETDDVIMNALGLLIGSVPYGIAHALERNRKTQNNDGQENTNGESIH